MEGIIGKIIEGITKRNQGKTPVLVPKDASVSKESSAPINDKELQTEVSRLKSDMRDALTKQDGPAIFVSEPTLAQRWEDLGNRRRKIFDELGNVLASINADSAKKQREKIPTTQHETKFYKALSLGVSAISSDVIDRELKFAKDHGFEERIKTYNQLLKFGASEEIFIRIKGVSIKDLLMDKKGSQFSPDQLYKFFVESALIQQKKSHRDIAEENHGYPQDNYPNKTFQYIDGTASSVIALIDLKPEDFNDFITHHNGIERAAGQRAKDLVEQVKELRNSIYNTLTDPTSPDFPALRDIMTVYLQGSKTERTIALYIAGLNTEAKTYDLYRKSRKLVKTNDNAQFFELLSNSIKKYIKDGYPIKGILTAEDLSSIFRMKNIDSAINIPKIEDFKIATSFIFSKSSTRKYDLNPEEIEWVNIVMPQSVVVNFDQSRPDKFSVQFHYENYEGESLNFNVTYDAKKGTSDWSFIETPNETPEMENFFKSILLSTKSILSKIEEKSLSTFKERTNEELGRTKAIPVSDSQKQEKRVHLSGKAQDDQREEITEQPKGPLTPIQQAHIDIDSMLLNQKGNGEKNNISIFIPADEILNDLMGKISSDDKETIRKGLARYNDHSGQMDIEKLKTGNYRLRIGDFRVILRKNNGEYEIVLIGNRQHIYTKQNKKALSD